MPYIFVALSIIFVALGGYTLAQYEPNTTDVPTAALESEAEVSPSANPTAEVTIEQTNDGVNVHVETKKESSNSNGSIRQEIDIDNSLSGAGSIDTNIQSHLSTE
jgi:hypothetical protein